MKTTGENKVKHEPPMLITLKLVAVLLNALSMALTLAHALEYPGKKRLTREHYLAVQTIYYPGFTYAGAAEPLAVLALIALALLTPAQTPPFWLIVGSGLFAALTHLLYWLLTAPVNKLWLKNEKLSSGATLFFGTGKLPAESADWTQARDRWERSHMFRAVTATIAFVLLIWAVALT